MATGGEPLESVLRGSDEHCSLTCLPCRRDDTEIPAIGYCIDCHEHLCQACYKHHKKATLSVHHNLLDKDAMPSTQQLTVTSPNAGTAKHLTTKCPRHPVEMIKLYCHDHDVLLCTICVTLGHNKTCHIDYIPDISDKMIDGFEYKQTINRIDKLLTKCTIVRNLTTRDINSSGDSLKDVIQEIKKYRQEINKRIDELQKEIEVKIQALQHQNDEHMQTVKHICEDVMKTLKVTFDSMKQLNTPLQANQLFMEVKQAQKQLQDYEQCINSLSTGDGSDEYKFTPSQAITDVLQKEKMIGDIAVQHHTRKESSTQSTLPESVKYDNITPTFLGEICVKTSKDLHRCCILGMTMLPPDRLILTDRNSQSIKLIGVNSKSITSQLTLDQGILSDIASTTTTQVAVTVPDRQHIQFISVSKKLSKAHTVRTDGQCYGICCYQNNLIVTYCNPGKLEILDMTGTVTKRVERDSTGRDLLNMPRYVHANSSSIYVSECGHNEVIMFNWNGEITGRTRGFKYPLGLALLGGDRILVCDNDDNKVYQVSSDCTDKRIILHDVKCPLVVYVDDGGRKLFISRGAKNDPHINNNILMYNI